jgi:hypothetical protein
VVVCENTLVGRPVRVPVDMVILCPAMEPRADAKDVARLFNLNQGADGFLLERHAKLEPVATANDGVFIVGCVQGPKDIPDTVAQALGGAAEALALIDKGRVSRGATACQRGRGPDVRSARACPSAPYLRDGEASHINEALQGLRVCVAVPGSHHRPPLHRPADPGRSLSPIGRCQTRRGGLREEMGLPTTGSKDRRLSL